MRPQRSRVRGSAVVSAVGRRIKKFTLCVTLLWLMAIFLFSFLPVPYSAVMLQKQLSAWLGGDFDYQTRQSWTPIEDISPYMTLAVIASEDQKFLTHWGFDFEAISSVMINRSRGASTLSQQTAKNLLLWNGRSWIRKGLEAGLTVGIELAWSKKRILTVYLNIAEFGNGIFGVEQASQTFFAKSAKQLTADEAALLAAVLPNPLRFKVNQPSGYVLNRQKWILRQMCLLGGTNAVKNL